MENDKKDTTQRVSTGFWALIDEFKDDVVGTVKKLVPFGVGALFIFPLIFTKEGREVLKEGTAFLKMKVGEQIAARAHDWGHRAFKWFLWSVVPMLIVLMAGGLYALILNTDPRDIADRLPGMFWNMMIVSIVMLLGFAALTPLVGLIGLSIGTIGAIDTVNWETIRSMPRFLMSGGKTGLGWIDGWWRITTKAPMFYCLGSLWLNLTPIHNDPAMKYIAGTVFLLLFFTHMAYKPGERGPFWWWVNWATAFTLADVMFWCMFPVLKLVFGLGVTPKHLAMVQERWPELMPVHMTFDNNEWWRILATILASVVIGLQIWWTVHLARNSGRPASAGRSGQVYSSGGVIYTPAPGLPRNVIGWIVGGLFAAFLVFMGFRHELFIRHNAIYPANVVSNELAQWGIGYFGHEPVVEGKHHYPDTQAGFVRLGANPDSFMVVLDPAAGGFQTIARTVKRGDVVNYRFLDTSYGWDSLGKAIRVPVDGYRLQGRVANPSESKDLSDHCLTLNANYGQFCLRIGEEGIPIGLKLPGGAIGPIQVGEQSLALGDNLMQLDHCLAVVSDHIRVIIWIDRKQPV